MFPCAKKIRIEAEQEEVIPATIDSLFDEVLVEIFGFLDAESLKNAALVCKTWDRLIGSTAVTMKKFVLQIYEKEGEEIEFDDEFVSTRRHQNVKLSRKDGVRILNNFDVSHAKTFEISLDDLTEPIWPILVGMTMLKCLTLKTVKFNGGAQQANFPKLVQLTVSHAESEDPFQYVRAENLEIFECLYVEDPIKAVEFLKSCEKLKSFHLNLFVLVMLLEIKDMFNMKFQLTELSVYPIMRGRVINAASFSRFLMSQANSLTSLSLHTYQLLDDWIEVYKTIFKLTKLTKLDINFYTHFINTFSQRIEVNPLRSLKELSLVVPDLSACRFELFLRRFPRLQKFSILCETTVSEGVIDILGRQPMLTSVKFHGASVKLTPIFDKIKINYGKLKTLVFLFSDHHTRFIRFDVPEDSTQWNVQEQEEKFQRIKEQQGKGEQSMVDIMRVLSQCEY